MGAYVGLLHPPLVGTDMVGHAVLPLEALLADGTGVGLLVRVGQTVAIEVVHVPERLSTRLARVVLPHRAGVGWTLGWTTDSQTDREGDRTRGRQTEREAGRQRTTGEDMTKYFNQLNQYNS